VVTDQPSGYQEAIAINITGDDDNNYHKQKDQYPEDDKT